MASPTNRAGEPSRLESEEPRAVNTEEEKPNKYGHEMVIDGQDSNYDSASEEELEVEETDNERPTGCAKDHAHEDPTRLEIEYCYFTFETPLPPPNTVQSAAYPDLSAPPPPNLKPYGDPHLWPESRKNILLALSCVATFLTAYTAGSFSPPAERMAAAFGDSLTVILFAGITVFCLGFAFAPMLLAPLSETNGRYPVFIVSGIVFVIFQVVCGVAPDLSAILIGRLLVGMGASVFSTMVGGVIADMWHAAGRNTPMALFSGFVLAGTGAGPLFSGMITYRTTAPYNPNDHGQNGASAMWRWVFWHQVISNSVLMVFLVLLFRESRGSVLLSKKARALNQWYENMEKAGYYGVWMQVERTSRSNDYGTAGGGGNTTDVPLAYLTHQQLQEANNCIPETPSNRSRLRRVRWLVKDDENRTTIVRMITYSVYRPFHMLFTEPVVFFFSLWVAFAWAVLYLMFGSVSFVFSEVYDWNIEKSARMFIALIIGAIISTIIGIRQDQFVVWLMPKRYHHRLHPDVPEARLYSACVMSTLLPVGLFIFGYTARPDYHWIAPAIGVCLSTMGIFTVYLSTFNYLADCYHRFASSALAAQSFCRNVLGGIFPLVMRPLFKNIGTAHACAILGSIAIGLTFVPWVLVFFGDTIRRRSRFAMSLEHS